MEIKPLTKVLEITHYLYITETQEYIMCVWECEVHTRVCYRFMIGYFKMHDDSEVVLIILIGSHLCNLQRYVVVLIKVIYGWERWLKRHPCLPPS